MTIPSLDQRSGWLLGVLLGAIFVVAQSALYQDVFPPLWITAGGFFLIGTVLGAVWPGRPWRWGVAPASAVAVLPFVLAVRHSATDQTLTFLLWALAAVGILAIVPAFLGALLGNLFAQHRSASPPGSSRDGV